VDVYAEIVVGGVGLGNQAKGPFTVPGFPRARSMPA
jgi:hypothetical protein